jgi:hypothetical protein
MNVKPGDIARLIYCPSFAENVGRQMVVMRAFPLPPGYRYVDAAGNRLEGHNWLCRLLQPTWAFTPSRGRFLAPAGCEFQTLDQYLRRVDPPGDTEELYRDVPTEEEKDLGLIVLSERLP